MKRFMNDYRKASKCAEHVYGIWQKIVAYDGSIYRCIWETKKQPKRFSHSIQFYMYMHTYTQTHSHTNRHCVMLKSLCASEYYLITTIIIRDRATHHTCTCTVCTLFVLFLSFSFFYHRTLPSHVTCTLARTRTCEYKYTESTYMYHDDRTHSFKIHSSQFSRWAQLLTCQP